MIVFVDMEHERLEKVDAAGWERSLAGCLRTKYRLEEIAGDRCLVVRYEVASPALLQEVKARAVVVSGFYTDFEHYGEEALAGMRAFLLQIAVPLLAICGAHQLLASAYGGEMATMGPLPAGAPDPYAAMTQKPWGYVPGQLQEHGFMRVHVDNGHPLFAGLEHEPLLFQAHYWEVKNLPSGWQVPAASELCAAQALVHGEQPLVGVQFHPERYDEAHPAGRRLLQNFFTYYVNNHR